MHRYSLTIEVEEKLTPGNQEHITALVNNLNNRNYIQFKHEEYDA